MLAQEENVFGEAYSTLFNLNQNEEIRYMCEMREEGQRIIRTYESMNRKNEEKIAQKNAVIAEKEAVIAEKDSALAEKDSALAEKDSALAEKDSALAEKEADLAKQQAVIEKLMAELRAYKGGISGRKR